MRKRADTHATSIDCEAPALEEAHVGFELALLSGPAW